MKTLHLAALGSREPAPGRYFVIGVKDSSVDLDLVRKKFPKAKIESLKEVKNPRYMFGSYDRNSHILQPAFITFS